MAIHVKPINSVVMCHHKCGTSFVLAALLETYGRENVHVAKDGRHLPRWKLPISKERIYGIVRDPWHWYYSRWRYKSSIGQANGLSFADSMRDIYKFGSVFGGMREGKPPALLVGNYTWQHFMYHSSKFLDLEMIDLPHLVMDCHDFLRVESLEKDLKEKLGVTDEACRQCRRRIALNRTLNWWTQYTPELVELVAFADKWCIERYGYRPPDLWRKPKGTV